jgi:hypothetical protein
LIDVKRVIGKDKLQKVPDCAATLKEKSGLPQGQINVQ